MAALLLPVGGCGFWNDPLLWSLDGRTISGGEMVRPTVWATGPTLAITRARDVTGYDAATGEPRWTVPLSGEVCAASPRPAGGRVAVQFGQGKPGCDRVAVIDLTAGRKVWEQPITPADRFMRGQAVISAGAVVVDWLYGTAAFRLDDGRPLWNVDSDRVDCAFQGLAGGPMLVAGRSCDADRLKVRRVEGLDPNTGRALWSYEAPLGYVVEVMVSTRPVVLGLRRNDQRRRVSRFVVLTTSGVQVTSIDVDFKSSLNCSIPEPYSRCRNIVVTGDSLYVRSGDRPGNDDKERTFAPIVSFDLATGRARWVTENPDGNHLFPIAMDGDRLIAAQPATAGEGGEAPRLVSVDAATGKTSIMWSLTRKADFRLRSGADRQYAHGRFFLTKTLVTGREKVALRAYGDTDG
ncbi:MULTISPECIES: PQQ-binding-like beta-propeller repeat protein [unclassified Spirillospora]|uniref:outer membrane protein assembly factor BamB family protein n=1 Tax=unclassified Spirillospora TaxID=2642701 RepID=UPI0037151DBC